MSFMDKVGGVTGLMGLVSSPDKVPALLLGTFPNATHTLARLRMFQEISARSGVLANITMTTLALALAQHRDITEEEKSQMDKAQDGLTAISINLHKFTKNAEEVDLAKLMEVFGFQKSDDRQGTQGQQEGEKVGT